MFTLLTSLIYVPLSFCPEVSVASVYVDTSVCGVCLGKAVSHRSFGGSGDSKQSLVFCNEEQESWVPKIFTSYPAANSMQ